VAACWSCGIEPAQAAQAIGKFTGVDRRMTEVGRHHGAIIVDDYGHHPTEIRATLAALRARYQPRRLICVFQPHQASRTRLLLEDFGTCFADADLIILPEIYYVRDSEEERSRIRAIDLVNQIMSHGKTALHIPELPAIAEYLRQEAREGDLIVTMGAGTVNEVGRELVS